MNVRSLIFILLCFAGHLYYGLSNNVVDRIIGGSDTDIKEVPWMLSLKLSFGDNKYALCGAAIINKRWAVTAAHCFHGSEDLKYLEGTLCSGSSKNIFYKNCNSHKIVKVVIHKKYDDPTHDYDIAVIQVTPAFSYNDYTKAVGLPSTSNMQNKEWGKVCGWGYYEKYNNGQARPVASENLKCALVPRTECPKDYHVTPRMICYGYQKGGIDSCQGDSGGPMTNGDNILIGITSWGKGCAVRGHPGVYTNVIHFLDWIKKNTVINA